MMESTDLRKLDYGTKLGRLNRPGFGSIFAQPQVSPRAQVICEIEIQQATQRRLVEHDGSLLILLLIHHLLGQAREIEDDASFLA